MQPLVRDGEGIDRAELQVIMPLHLMAATLKFAYRIWQMLQKYSDQGLGGVVRGETPSDVMRAVAMSSKLHFSFFTYPRSRITIPIALQNMQICGQGNPPHTASPRSGSPGQLFGNCLPSKTVLAPGLWLQCQMPVESIVNCHKNSIENIEKIYMWIRMTKKRVAFAWRVRCAIGKLPRRVAPATPGEFELAILYL